MRMAAAAGLVCIVLFPAVASADGRTASAAACESLARTLALPNTTVTLSQAVAAGKFVPPGGGAAIVRAAAALPAFCRVTLKIAPSPDSDIRSEVWLPMSGWNGKFLQVGNGAWGGSIQYGPLGDALRRGYAAASTDTGHTGTDASFAMGPPEKLVDFGYRSVHETAVQGKATVTTLYGERPRVSYFNGCSGGGRMSFMEAQRFPEDFDGIIAGAPGYNRTDVAFQTLGMAQATHVSAESFIPASKYEALHQAALDACDALDGLKDGLIADPTACRFDPAAIACKSGDGPGCLTSAQVVAARRIYAPVIDPKNGAQISSGLEPGSERQWASVTGSQPHSMYNDLLRFVVMKDPNWDYRTLDVGRQLEAARRADRGILAATSTDLSPFVSRGGKLLMYHGWADQNIPPRESIAYYNGVVKTMGEAKVAGAVRLFMVPGMGHCGGGDGPNEFDMLAALEQWREQGKAPSEILASQVSEGRVTRTRPLCPYPQIARYKGTGSVDRAENFACAQRTGQVVGSRSFSPIVADVDAAMKVYTAVGLTVPPPANGTSYPWDDEAWHYDLHGGQAPGSQMRFAYATVPGAVSPATPLLVEPVEHRGTDRTPRTPRAQNPGSTTLVLVVRDLDRAVRQLPEQLRQPIRKVAYYGKAARAMTVAKPGMHLIELLQPDPVPASTAPMDANTIGGWVRVSVADLDRTLALYRDQFGLAFRISAPSDAEFGGVVGASGASGASQARLRLGTATLPGTNMTLEFLEVTGVDRSALDARIQDPGAARIQLTVANLDTTLQTLSAAGPSTVVSTGGRIITQPRYRVAVVSDLNGLYLVLTDQRKAP